METELERYNRFCEEAGINDPYHYRKRQDGLYFADVEIVSVKNPNWWYKDFIGLRFFALLEYSYRFSTVDKLVLDNIYPVRLTRSKVYRFMSIDPVDCIII